MANFTAGVEMFLIPGPYRLCHTLKYFSTVLAKIAGGKWYHTHSNVVQVQRLQLIVVYVPQRLIIPSESQQARMGPACPLLACLHTLAFQIGCNVRKWNRFPAVPLPLVKKTTAGCLPLENPSLLARDI
jgi:hypothetical protein